MTRDLSRRSFLKSGAVSMGTIGVATRASADVVPGTDGFEYEVVKSHEAWLNKLGDHDFGILRLGQTEAPKSNPLWNETRNGDYRCKGCELNVYSSNWKVPLEKGWAFFRQSVPNALLMNIDWPEGAGPGLGAEILAAIEVHCRRCGSHMGHILLVEGQILHCINGSSMTFEPAAL